MHHLCDVDSAPVNSCIAALMWSFTSAVQLPARPTADIKMAFRSASSTFGMLARSPNSGTRDSASVTPASGTASRVQLILVAPLLHRFPAQLAAQAFRRVLANLPHQFPLEHVRQLLDAIEVYYRRHLAIAIGGAQRKRQASQIALTLTTFVALREDWVE